MKLFGKKINKKPSKWHNTPCEYNGIKFDSHKERDRYIFLKSLQDKGVISDLKCQVRYTVCPAVYGEREVEYYTEKLHVKKTKIEKYTKQTASYYYADFTYMLNGELVVEDVKGNEGVVTDTYVLKKKLMLAYNNIEVIEVYNPTVWNHVNSGKKPR
jgi:hypothetical protein